MLIIIDSINSHCVCLDLRPMHQLALAREKSETAIKYSKTYMQKSEEISCIALTPCEHVAVFTMFQLFYRFVHLVGCRG